LRAELLLCRQGAGPEVIWYRCHAPHAKDYSHQLFHVTDGSAIRPDASDGQCLALRAAPPSPDGLPYPLDDSGAPFFERLDDMLRLLKAAGVYRLQ
jgi:hypothetical protein